MVKTETKHSPTIWEYKNIVTAAGTQALSNSFFLHFSVGTVTVSQLCHQEGNFYLVLVQNSHHPPTKSFEERKTQILVILKENI